MLLILLSENKDETTNIVEPIDAFYILLKFDKK